MWSVNYQYSIEFAPILTIGIFDVVASIKKEKLKTFSAIITVVFALICSIHLMDNTIIMYDKARLRIYDSIHYSREFPIRKAHDLLSKIPVNAPVSAQSAFVPHLSCRTQVYQFPIIKDAEYIMLAPRDNYYPIDSANYFYITDSLKCSPLWKTIHLDHDFILFERKSVGK
jgi:hypothetical protein